jgi:hypothetical protein
MSWLFLPITAAQQHQTFRGLIHVKLKDFQGLYYSSNKAECFQQQAGSCEEHLPSRNSRIVSLLVFLEACKIGPMTKEGLMTTMSNPFSFAKSHAAFSASVWTNYTITATASYPSL